MVEKLEKILTDKILYRLFGFCFWSYIISTPLLFLMIKLGLCYEMDFWEIVCRFNDKPGIGWYERATDFYFYQFSLAGLLPFLFTLYGAVRLNPASWGFLLLDCFALWCAAGFVILFFKKRKIKHEQN